MSARELLPLLAATAFIAAALVGTKSSGEPAASCTPDLGWFADPSDGPTIHEIDGKLGRPPDQCHFHSLAWQWFLYLMHPVGTDEDVRNFEDQQKYAVLGRDLCPQCPQPHDGGGSDSSGWFIRNIKEATSDPRTGLFHFLDASSDAKTPISICNQGALPNRQPGSELTLHDQFGKLVFYRVLYKRNLCKIYALGGRDAQERILEMKFSWRQIGEGEKQNYLHRTVDLPIIGTTLIGLVGIHMAIDTTWNQRMAWATFEHKQNAADCDKPARDDGWSFTSAACARCLRTGSLNSCAQAGAPCDNINTGYARANNSGTPITHVCRAHPETGADQPNRTAIATINAQLVGPNGLLTRLPASDPMAVLSNYFHVGTLWLIPDSDAPENQQGSRLLANTTLESFQQERNCFTCHKPSGSQNTYPVSHILPRGAAAGKR